MLSAVRPRAVVVAALLLPLAAHAAAPTQGPPTAPPVLSVTTTVPTAPTATIVQGTVTITNPPDTGYRLVLAYGEGRETTLVDALDDSTDTCTTQAGGTQRFTFRHPYRMAGVWTIRATLVLGCGLGPANPTFAGTAPLTITPGAVVSNGPIRPAARLLAVPPEAFRRPGTEPPPPPPPPPSLFARRPGEDEVVVIGDPNRGPQKSWGVFNLFGWDEDGFITQVRIHWGDGSRDTIIMGVTSRCEEPALKQHWPESSLADTLKHPFKRGRRYTTTLTVTTKGCDGRDPQTATNRLVHTAQ